MVLAFFFAAVGVYRDGFNGASFAALVFMFLALCIAPLERKRGD